MSDAHMNLLDAFGTRLYSSYYSQRELLPGFDLEWDETDRPYSGTVWRFLVTSNTWSSRAVPIIDELIAQGYLQKTDEPRGTAYRFTQTGVDIWPLCRL